MFPISEWVLGLLLISMVAISACTPQGEEREPFRIRGEVPFDGLILIEK